MTEPKPLDIGDQVIIDDPTSDCNGLAASISVLIETEGVKTYGVVGYFPGRRYEEFPPSALILQDS